MMDEIPEWAIRDAKDRARRLFKRISAGYALPTVNEIAEAILDAEREQMESLRKQIGELRPTGNSNTYHCGYEDARDDAIAVIRKQQAAADRSAGKE